MKLKKILSLHRRGKRDSLLLHDLATKSKDSMLSTTSESSDKVVDNLPTDSHLQLTVTSSSGHAVPKKIQKKELINTHRQKSSDLKQVKDICAKLQIILQKLYDDTSVLRGCCWCLYMSAYKKVVEESIRGYKAILTTLEEEESEEVDEQANLLGRRPGSGGTLNLMEKCRRYSILENTLHKQENRYAHMTSDDLWDDLGYLDREVERFRKLAQQEAGKLRRLDRRYERLKKRRWCCCRGAKIQALVEDATENCLKDEP